jgi:hypothetical protein
VYRAWVNCTGGLYRQRGESQNDPKPLGKLVEFFEPIPSGSYQAAVDNTKVLVVFSVDINNQARKKNAGKRTNDAPVKTKAYGAAPNALFWVSFLMAEKVLVITATKRLISQRFRTMTQIMEKKQETKDSESIIEYIGAVNCRIASTPVQTDRNLKHTPLWVEMIATCSVA